MPSVSSYMASVFSYNILKYLSLKAHGLPLTQMHAAYFRTGIYVPVSVCMYVHTYFFLRAKYYFTEHSWGINNLEHNLVTYHLRLMP